MASTLYISWELNCNWQLWYYPIRSVDLVADVQYMQTHLWMQIALLCLVNTERKEQDGFAYLSSSLNLNKNKDIFLSHYGMPIGSMICFHVTLQNFNKQIFYCLYSSWGFEWCTIANTILLLCFGGIFYESYCLLLQ